MPSDGSPAPSRDDPPGEPPALRVGVIRRGPGAVFPAWQAHCLGGLLDLDGVEVVLLVSDERAPDRDPSGVPHTPMPRLDNLLWTMYHSVWIRRRSRASHPVSLDDLLSGVPEVCLRDEPPGAASGRAGALDAIRAADLDVILDVESSPISREIAEMARHGAWSFGFGDPQTSGDGPACFWEVYRGDVVTRAALEGLSGADAQRSVLYEGYVKTIRYSYPRHRDAVLLGVADWPARACRQILAGVPPVPTPVPAPPAPGSAAAVPTNREMVRLLGVTAWRVAGATWAALVRRDEWNVGIAEAPIHAFLQPGARPQIRWIPRARGGSFLADPFVADHGDAAGVLVEAFDARDGKGRIVVLAVESGGGLGPPEPAIEAPVHLSYPYLIEHAGQIYCVPEMHQAGKVDLYRATAFPHGWVRCATLIEGIAIADATVFVHDNRWWLLCSVEGDHPNTTLHAWHAADLSGPWAPHPANPLKTDVRSSRPAGAPFAHGGRLYRPAQDCSQTYGGAVVINHVQRLTPAEFAEEPVARVEPDHAGPYPHGLHTLSAWGQRTLIDGKRRRFAPWGWWWPLRSALGRLTAHGSDRLGLRRPLGTACRRE